MHIPKIDKPKHCIWVHVKQNEESSCERLVLFHGKIHNLHRIFTSRSHTSDGFVKGMIVKYFQV